MDANELREALAPKLSGIKEAIHKNEKYKAYEIINDVHEWLDNRIIVEGENNGVHICGGNKDWTR